MKTIFYRKTT